MKFIKKIISFSLIIIILLVLLIVFLGNPTLDYITQTYLIPKLTKDDLELTIEEPSIKFISLNANTIEVSKQIKFLSLPFKLTNVELQPNIVTLFSKNKKFKFYSDLYKGSLKLSLNLNKANNFFSSSGVLDSVVIGNYNYFKTLGIKNGILNTEFNKIEVENKILKELDLFTSIQDLSFINKVKLPVRLTGLPFPIEIPPFNISSLEFKTDVKGKSYEISNIICVSSLLSFRGFVSSSKNEVNLDIKLTEKGFKEYGSLFKAFSNTKADAKSYSINSTLDFRKFKLKAKI